MNFMVGLVKLLLLWYLQSDTVFNSIIELFAIKKELSILFIAHLQLETI